MHGLLGLPLPEGDLYEVVDCLADDPNKRDVVKTWVAGTFGKGSPVVKWSKKKLDSDHPAWGYDARAIGAAVIARYPFLANPAEAVIREADPTLSKRLLTHLLCWIESKVIGSAMRELRQVGILSLPMFDGLIVPQSAELLAIDALLRAGEEIGKVRLRLK